MIVFKKTVAEAHRLLSSIYSEAAPRERTCHEWFQRFKSGDFDIEDQNGDGKKTIFEDSELEALLAEDSCQTQEELTKSMGVTQQAISKCPKAMCMIQKQENWVPYELKPRDVERRFFACDQLLQKLNRKGFLHRIVSGDKKWIHYDNSKRRRSWGMPGHAFTSTARPNIHGAKVMLCIWWDQLVMVYYELFEPSETISGNLYRTQLMRLSRALKENAYVSRPFKTYLETLKWEVLPYPSYSSDVSPSHYHLFQSMTHSLTHQHFCSYEEVKKWINSSIASKDASFFRDGI